MNETKNKSVIHKTENTLETNPPTDCGVDVDDDDIMVVLDEPSIDRAALVKLGALLLEEESTAISEEHVKYWN